MKKKGISYVTDLVILVIFVLIFAVLFGFKTTAVKKSKSFTKLNTVCADQKYSYLVKKIYYSHYSPNINILKQLREPKCE